MIINSLLARTFPQYFKPQDSARKIRFEYSPISSQTLLNYVEMYEDGICKLADGVYSLAIEFEDTNYTNATDEDQEHVFIQYVNWLNSIGEHFSIQMWLSSQRISAQDLGQQLNFSSNDDDTEYEKTLKDEYNVLIESKVASNNRAMRRIRTYILTTKADSYSHAKQLFDPIIEQTHQYFVSIKVIDHVLNGLERLNLINTMTNPSFEGNVNWYKELDTYPSATTKDLVCPRYVHKSQRDYLEVSDRYIKTYFVHTWGTVTKDSLLSEFLNVPCDAVVSEHLQSWDDGRARELLQDRLYSINLEISDWVAKHTDVMRGKMPDENNAPMSLKRKKQEAENLIEQFEDNNQRIFDVTLTVTLSAYSEQELAHASEVIENIGRKYGISLVSNWKEVRTQLFSTALPLGNPAFGSAAPQTKNFAALYGAFSRIMLTDNVASLMPFTSVNMLDQGGMFLGVNKDTRDFVVYNFDKHDSPNGFSFGQGRSGKSVGIKSMITQMRFTYPDADIIVVDPEREYLKVAKELQGQVIDFSDGSQDHINPFDLSNYYSVQDVDDHDDGEQDPLPFKISYLQGLFHLMSKEISDEEMNIIDLVAGKVYEQYLKTHDEADIPTLKDFYDELDGITDNSYEYAQHLKTLLYRFVEGSASMYNHKTNVELNNKLVIYDISSLSDNMKPLGYYVILNHIWVKVTKNRFAGKRTIVVVDEMQYLLEDDYALSFFDMLWARSGKWGCILHAVTQNVNRLFGTPRAKIMLENSHFFCLYRQAKTNIDTLQDFFNLSDAQRNALETPSKGEGLYIFDSNKVINFNNRIPKDLCPTLYRMFTTKFTDIVEYKREAAKDK